MNCPYGSFFCVSPIIDTAGGSQVSDRLEAGVETILIDLTNIFLWIVLLLNLIKFKMFSLNPFFKLIKIFKLIFSGKFWSIWQWLVDNEVLINS